MRSKSSVTTAPGIAPARTRGGVGETIVRPDGVPKVKGQFAYSSDLWS
jgi:hypothetical protein